MELETQIIIARRLGFMAQQGCNRLLQLTAELGRMLAGLRQKLARLDRRHKSLLSSDRIFRLGPRI